MNLIAQLVTPGDILPDLEVSNKLALFQAVGQICAQSHGISAAEVVVSLMAREDKGSTAIGHELAIPHARIKGLALAQGFFVRTRFAIDFDAPDGEPVSCFFVLLVPENAREQHLQILAHAAEMLSNPEVRDQLTRAVDAETIFKLFSAWRPSAQRGVTEDLKR